MSRKFVTWTVGPELGHSEGFEWDEWEQTPDSVLAEIGRVPRRDRSTRACARLDDGGAFTNELPRALDAVMQGCREVGDTSLLTICTLRICWSFMPQSAGRKSVLGGPVGAAATPPLLIGYSLRIGKQTSVTQLVGSSLCAGLTR